MAVGDGVSFTGIYEFSNKKIKLFSKEIEQPGDIEEIDASNLDSQDLITKIGEDNINKLKEDIELITEMIPKLDQEEFLAGIQTPVFFGSALYSFGVSEMMKHLAINAPGPTPKAALEAPYDNSSKELHISPNESQFSGFIFKIQANMDKNHRDRMAFLRVCSGVFKRNQKIHHTRTEKDIKIASQYFSKQKIGLLQKKPIQVI